LIAQRERKIRRQKKEDELKQLKKDVLRKKQELESAQRKLKETEEWLKEDEKAPALESWEVVQIENQPLIAGGTLPEQSQDQLPSNIIPSSFPPSLPPLALGFKLSSLWPISEAHEDEDSDTEQGRSAINGLRLRPTRVPELPPIDSNPEGARDENLSLNRKRNSSATQTDNHADPTQKADRVSVARAVSSYPSSSCLPSMSSISSSLSSKTTKPFSSPYSPPGMLKHNSHQECILRLHKSQWENLETARNLTWQSFPWPTFNLNDCQSPEAYTAKEEDVKEYIRFLRLYSHPSPSQNHWQNPAEEDSMFIAEYAKRWHHDRFEAKILNRVDKLYRERVTDCAQEVEKVLSLMSTRS
jgi:hypothetical protein